MSQIVTASDRAVPARGVSRFVKAAAKAVASGVGGFLESLASTPAYFWVYIGALLYITRRLTYKHGYGSKKVTVGGRKIRVNSAEEAMLDSVIDTSRITVDFSDVGGLQDVKTALTEHIVWPFKRPEYFTGKTIRSHPKGVLLYGPPGTGKTLLARALAKELGCSFINVNTETIFSKWVGETERNAAAIFTLAEKISPCVIFVDEVDSLLSMRTAQDATPHSHAKTIFMTHWDGLEKNNEARIIVVGATNRRLFIDDAIRRRMPLQLEVPPPDLAARRSILSIALAHDLENNPQRDAIINHVATKAVNYTGSDLTELCKAAALMPMRELQAGGGAGDVPPLTIAHFDEALKRVRASS